MTAENKSYKRDGRAPIPVSEKTSKVMSANKAQNTNPELKLRKFLYHQGVKGYRINWRKVPGKPDIAFPGKKVAIFVHGCFWHRCPSCNLKLPKSNSEFWSKKFEANILRDKRNLDELNRMGWTVIIIWECEIKRNIEEVSKNIKIILSKFNKYLSLHA